MQRNVWHRSEYCGAGNCVEVMFTAGGEVLVRNSNSRKILRYTEDEWAAFVKGVKNNEFD